MNAVHRTASISASLFSNADAQFATMKETLTSADFQGKTAAEVQPWLAIAEKELMRQLFQSDITLRGQKEAQGPVGDDEGVHHTQIVGVHIGS